jgi:hypothetical protein
MLNSLAGLIATITNIYTARDKFWSRTAIFTAGITGTYASIYIIHTPKLCLHILYLYLEKS